jgi:hypothetical protein
LCWSRWPGPDCLLLRARNIDLGPPWAALEPGLSVMERGRLLGIRERAERAGGGV